ncbi:aromatic ring-hydroxylating dioxygenase subunit alpha [Novosphingobium sp. G106]|uniref:aromatic ring-hydroxylating oxygenase subunit alpha n=1 Tax=Novosphingobium sp. G106 TaxID=2849500 RepID=UPI001C2DB633|nr:aromatic ring-hydroxylating dioxygenase subunit alpha [Novosphingobium sp. G106]MBV1688939.1 aromatic ring-hydroxylating dioxygenase subunit alpha [Novosphingobium sp. G106]
MGTELNNVDLGRVPHAVTEVDRIPAKRYYDREFYDLEVGNLWPRVWQMACRLEEIPEVGDYTVYRNLDQSIIVVRTAPDTIKAYHNHCRHRGVELVNKSGRAAGGFICPFHGWRWDKEGNNTFVFQPDAFSEQNMCKDDLALRHVKADTWGGCAWINLDEYAPPLLESLGEFGPQMDLYKVDELKVEWWYSAHLPVNWKLAMEAFMEGYHVASTHPQLLPPGATSRPGEALWLKLPEEARLGSRWLTMSPAMPDEIEPSDFIDTYIEKMTELHVGMAGMVSQEEIAVAERLRDVDLPRNPHLAMTTWRKLYNQALTDDYRERGMEIGNLDEIDAAGMASGVNFCFPHFFLLPVHGVASSYRIRPLGPEECLFELWSLKRYPKDEKRPVPVAPTPKPHDDPQWPEIPLQDYANLPRQQRGLHTGGFEFMRLSKESEGLISNYQRLIDGYIAGVPSDKLAHAAMNVSGGIDREVLDLGF